MTLDEKVGQMTQVDKRMLDSEEDIAKFFLGSILSGGGSVPDDNTTKGWVKMVNRYQAQALSTRLKIPLIYGIDAVHGIVMLWVRPYFHRISDLAAPTTLN